MIKNISYGVIFILLCFSCKDENALKAQLAPKLTDKIPVSDFKTLEPLLYTTSDTTYIVNFWAMWCAPCIKELPYFVAYANAHKDENVEVIFVSLDFPEDIESKLIPFIQEKKITSKVVLLDEPDANSWIDKISPNWSGAIPFTIVFDKEQREYYERTFESLEDLEYTIHKNFNIK